MSGLQDKNFILHMYKQQQLGENVDFMIESGEQRIYVHSLFVRFCNPYLKLLLQSSCLCNQPTVLILPPLYASLLPNFVSLLYTGMTNKLSNDDLKNLKCLVRDLGFEHLAFTDDEEQSNDNIVAEPPEILLKVKGPGNPVLKTETNIEDHGRQESFKLSFPRSRSVRVFSNLKDIDLLDGFEGRVQKEYNECPVGSYVGPYDQNESLSLSLQLPNSNLDYENYSEFVHPQNVSCRHYSISTKYVEFDDLKKLDALEIHTEESDEDEKEDDDEEKEKEFYTCYQKKCRIPCPCSPCSTLENQCTKHKIKHMKLFDVENDAITIRSSEDFCRDKSFFNLSYINKYPGIPKHCVQCRKDLVHHKSYHISFHESCKFCIQNWFKLRAKNPSEFNKNREMEEHYHNSVCPYCNKKFCEPYFAKKHIEFEHGTAPFMCEICSKRFHSDQALKYHRNAYHSDFSPSHPSQKCSICNKAFMSDVSLKNHKKYVHSDVRRHACKSCESKFKQKKHLREHNLRVHGINQYKEEYHHPKEVEKLPCDHCSSVFKYRRDLNSHIRTKHKQGDQKFTCEQCPSKYVHKKSLQVHIKLKHGTEKEEFGCPVCQKKFELKKRLTRHLLIHD